MPPARKILLITLLLVLGSVTITLLLDSGGNSAAQSSQVTSEGNSTSDAGNAAAEDLNVAFKKTFLLIVGVVAAAILLFSFALPYASDRITARLTGPDDELEADIKALAAARIAEEDYEGAIAEYEKLLDRDPPDRFPIDEIVRLHLENLASPQSAINVLQKSLNDKEWEVDDAASLRFRIASIELENRNDPFRAREVLESIVQEFQGTRHAANAEHRIEEIDSAT